MIFNFRGTRLILLNFFLIIFYFLFLSSCSFKKNYNQLSYQESHEVLKKKFENDNFSENKIQQNKQNQNKQNKINLDDQSDDENYDEVMEYMNENAFNYKKIDPAEKLNRKLFLVHNAFDRVLLHPISILYNVIPKPITNSFSNFLSNIFSPLRILCHLLSGNFHNAATTTWRLICNTTFGVFGIFDPASKLGVEKTESNFADVFKKIGVNSGPYLIIPVLGPMNLRSFLGLVFDTFCDPVFILVNSKKILGKKREFLKTSHKVMVTSSAIVVRAGLDSTLTKMQKKSTFSYDDLRSIYVQQNQ